MSAASPGRIAAATLPGFMLVGAVPAQGNYPAKPVRLIVPSSPGGGIDRTARVISTKLSERLGQPVTLDYNKVVKAANINPR